MQATTWHSLSQSKPRPNLDCSFLPTKMDPVRAALALRFALHMRTLARTELWAEAGPEGRDGAETEAAGVHGFVPKKSSSRKLPVPWKRSRLEPKNMYWGGGSSHSFYLTSQKGEWGLGTHNPSNCNDLKKFAAWRIYWYIRHAIIWSQTNRTI